MYVTEVYIANVQSMFVFMAFKYCYGALHIVFLPFIILIMKKDIRRAAVNTYVKGKEDDNGEKINSTSSVTWSKTEYKWKKGNVGGKNFFKIKDPESSQN